MSVFKTYNILVIRKTQGEYLNGMWKKGKPETFYVRSSFQPLKSEELLSLPEGRRERTSYKIYPKVELKGIDDQQPDIIINPLNGDQYEVIQLEQWRNGLINHNKAIIGLKSVFDVFEYELLFQNGNYVLNIDGNKLTV